MRLWIDTDAGTNPDDAIALLCAAAHPQVELVGVSTTGPEPRASASVVTEVLRWRGADDVLLYAGPPDPRALVAAEAVLAIGPLTNLARLVRAGVDLPPVAAMGGVLHPPVLHRGAARTVDSNFAADPFAAAVVVHSVADLLLVPLDVTAPAVLDAATRLALVAAVPELSGPLDEWTQRTGAPVCLHDPLALWSLLGEFATVERMHIGVGGDGGLLLDAPSGTLVDREVVVDAAQAAMISATIALLA